MEKTEYQDKLNCIASDVFEMHEAVKEMHSNDDLSDEDLNKWEKIYSLVYNLYYQY